MKIESLPKNVQEIVAWRAAWKPLFDKDGLP